MDTVMVTGGAGYIGSHTCKMLSQAGLTPVVYDNLATGHADSVKWGPLVKGDVRDRDRLRSAIRQWQPTCLIHFAASAYVGESVTEPAKYYNNNVAGMIALMDCCIDTRLRRVVFSSSCATYGTPNSLPICEGDRQCPINPYGRTKLIGEMILRDYAVAHPLRYAALRYFNAAGADPEGALGECHEPETHLIPLVLQVASSRRAHITVYGEDYPTADGTCIRDYIHVSDLAWAHVLAYEHLARGGGNLAVNLGTGRGASILEILETIDRVTGHSVPIAIQPRRAGDPPVLYADPSLARSTLGFSPQYSDLDTIVRTAAPFFGLGACP